MLVGQAVFSSAEFKQTYTKLSHNEWNLVYLLHPNCAQGHMCCFMGTFFSLFSEESLLLLE